MKIKQTTSILTGFTWTACLFLFISCGQSERRSDEQIQADVNKAKEKTVLRASSNLADALAYLDKKDFRTASYKAQEIINECPTCPEAGSAKELLNTIAENSKLDEKLYEIISGETHGATQSFNIYYKGKRNRKSIEDFILKFRFKHTTMQNNIYLYDTKSIKKLLAKYPVTEAEDKLITSHTIAEQTFDSGEVYIRNEK